MEIECNLSQNDDSPSINQPEYRPMIKSLLYLTSTRLDIMHAFGLLDDFKQILKKIISKQLREYSSIYKELKILVYGIQKM